MKKIKVKVIKSNDVGLEEGKFKTLSPDIANRLIRSKQAEFVAIVEKRKDSHKVEELELEISILKEDLQKSNDTIKKLKDSNKKK